MQMTFNDLKLPTEAKQQTGTALQAKRSEIIQKRSLFSTI
jgi:hypothetical protein